MSPMKIRDATPDDIPALAELNAHVSVYHVAAEPDVYRVADARSLEGWVAEYLERDGAAGLIAEANGEAIGYALFRFHRLEPSAFIHGWSYLYVDQLGVAPDARRRGVGRALMAAVEARARAIGVDQVELDVREVNDEAKAFYRSLGYAARRVQMSIDVRAKKTIP